MNDPRYPIGPFVPDPEPSPATREQRIREIAEAPARLREAVAGLTEAQLDTPYRDGGWTVRQVVHHVPDSHVNSYTRWKLAITEDEPTIRPYDEVAWAELPEARTGEVEMSLALLEALHRRWVVFLRGLTSDQFARRLRHPVNGVMTLDHLLGLYAWHGRHHVAHVTALRERLKW